MSAPTQPKKTKKPNAPRRPTTPAAHRPRQIESNTINHLGREWTIDAGALDDWELLEALADGDEGVGAVVAVKRLLGDQQYEDLKNLLRDTNGRVPATAFAETLGKLFSRIFEAVTKKSKAGNR